MFVFVYIVLIVIFLFSLVTCLFYAHRKTTYNRMCTRKNELDLSKLGISNKGTSMDINTVYIIERDKLGF